MTTNIVCNSSFAPQQSFVATTVCSQSKTNTTILAAIFGSVETILLLIIVVASYSNKKILPTLAIATALIDDIVVYTVGRQSIASQVMLIIWTCLVTSTSKNGYILMISPLIALPVAIVTDVTRGALVYVFVSFFASKFWVKKLAPFAEIAFISTSIACIDFIASSETGANSAEVVISALKFVVGCLLLWELRMY